eukprot:NODE_14809_length_1084_cov_5.158830.p2 GENE.NODE_14809_length_1084_cov_5.158830~~NODE_14809_length_1084_cov_5.158830.p2  ORF type:complete len:183 (+),score=48.25 NODE_14809_length_1084_cov_5.158830:193-741(+)
MAEDIAALVYADEERAMRAASMGAPLKGKSNEIAMRALGNDAMARQIAALTAASAEMAVKVAALVDANKVMAEEAAVRQIAALTATSEKKAVKVAASDAAVESIAKPVTWKDDVRLAPFIPKPLDKTKIIVGGAYEAVDNVGKWHAITITRANENGTYSAKAHDLRRSWPIVYVENIRNCPA